MIEVQLRTLRAFSLFNLLCVLLILLEEVGLRLGLKIFLDARFLVKVLQALVSAH